MTSTPTTGEKKVLLRDGGVALVRGLTTQDGPALLALHEDLSPQTLYLRFFSASRLSAKRYVSRLIRPESSDHGAVVLELQGRLVGVAAYERLEDGGPTPASEMGCAEVAFVVADDQHGRGIGTLLLEDLAALARSRGIHRFTAETLARNAPMLHVFRDAGFDVAFKSALDTVEVSINLTPGAQLLTAVDERERSAARASLEPFMHARSLAVVGASAREHSVGAAVLTNVLRAGFTGPIYPVNSRLADQPGPHLIQGLPAFAELSKVPGPVDLVVVAVPASAVLGLVDDCRTVGAKALVVLSAGFADVGAKGALLQQRLKERAAQAGIRIVGPNCLGITALGPAGMLAATFAPGIPLPGRVGVLSQSGGLGIALLEHTRQAGIGLSSFVSVGNKADVSGNDLLCWWDEDPMTDIAVLYLESFGNPRKFARFARHVSGRKPVVAIKSGNTPVGARAARSHTAAAATPARSVAALFRQAGVINVSHVGELIDVVTMLSTQPLPDGPRLAIIGNAGGPGILAADAASECGLDVPQLSPKTQSQLSMALPGGAAVGNPVDTIASVSGSQFAAAVSLLLADPDIDAVLAVITPTPLTEPDDLSAALAEAAAGASKPVAMTRVGSDHVTGVLATGGSHPIPAYAFPETAVRALSRAAEYSRFRDRPTGVIPVFSDIRTDEARAVIATALRDAPDGGWMVPGHVEQLLAAYGVSSLEGRVVSSAAAAAKAAQQLGLPVAVKAVGPTLVHKSDVGGVALNLKTSADVRRAYRQMSSAIGARMTSALIQPMAPTGIEVIAGITSHPSFGPLVMFGLGGIWADLLADQAFRLVPLTDVDAAELVGGLRTTPLLNGYRGSPKCDVGALKELLLRLAQLADDNPELAELDLNPVIVNPDGVTVLDAKARIVPIS